ncbi:16S rRNA (cytidine(1402)-2'-O)-methyltransferase [bacterium]|nr:16S rRNA (cytidine(1402)-2'-O)-methyltransferase [bacterium]
MKSVKTGELYIIGTPIGNLEDMTIRAIKTLRAVDVVFAEDTRKAHILFQRYNIRKRTYSLHSHNEKERLNFVFKLLEEEGKSVGVISESGMPAISDPGYLLIREAISRGINPLIIPGPTAFVSALLLSGLKIDNFLFIGFPPSSPKKRRRLLRNLVGEEHTMVFYVSPHRLTKFLNDVMSILGDRDVAITRELTKKYEEAVRGKVSELLDYYSRNDVRGEFSVVVSGGEKGN